MLTLGVKTTTEEVAPDVHVKLLAPVAVKLALAPAQTEALPVTLMVGFAFIVNKTVAVFPAQPNELVPVKE